MKNLKISDIRKILVNKLNGEGSSFTKEEILQEVIDYIDECEKNSQFSNKPNFNKNIAWFDLETSGMIKEKHRILEIAISVINPEGEIIDSFYSLVNPDDGFGEVPIIDEEAIALNRLDIFECYKAPTLSELAPRIKELLEKNDLGGYNIEHFDIPFLIEQFHRIEDPINLNSCKIIDIYKILVKAEPRKLVNISERFLGEVQTNAHSAINDVSTTYRICSEILKEFNLTHLNNSELQEYAFGADQYFDSDKKLKKMLNSNNVAVDALFCFGKKYTGHRFSIVLETDPNYIDWILKSDFSKDTKLWVQKLRKVFLDKKFKK